ncbi:hypothetical protein P8452_73543 [Trifolium repens]|nr:hypothetical protein P8452_73543 [Trifolium repens]
MSEFRTAKTRRGKKELQKRAPKLIESGKKTLVLHGTKTSSVLNAVLTQIYHLKKESAVKYSRKNDNIKPFEAGGETSLEFFSQKTDCYSCCMDLTQRSDLITLLLGEHMITMSMIW